MTTVLNSAPAGYSIICSDLFHLYSTLEGEVVALRSVDLTVKPGEMVALVGPSGMGKSTLLGLMAGLFPPTTGEITIGPYSLSRMSKVDSAKMRSKDVAVVLQDASRNLLPYASILQNLSFASRTVPKSLRSGPMEQLSLLSELGLSKIADRTTDKLSGGERQRSAFAAALVNQPKVLLIDEPTSQLDSHSKAQVIESLRNTTRRHGVTVVVVTHDEEVASTADRSLTIRDGRVGTQSSDGVDYLVVGKDGVVQLPKDILESFPPDSLMRIRREQDRIILERSSRNE